MAMPIPVYVHKDLLTLNTNELSIGRAAGTRPRTPRNWLGAGRGTGLATAW